MTKNRKYIHFVKKNEITEAVFRRIGIFDFNPDEAACKMPGSMLYIDKKGEKMKIFFISRQK